MKDENNNTGKNNSGDWNSGDGNSGYWNSGYGNSGDGNSGDGNSGDWNSGKNNSGDWNSGKNNSGDWNSGKNNLGDWNSGYGNSTDRESGIFCSTKSKVRLFNKDTDLTWEEINHPHFNEFELCKWIPESKMTDEEKKKEADFAVREGYLKEYSYKDAWANFWRDTDEENRETFLSLPNFDVEVFKEITGIDVNNQSNEMTIEELEKLTGIKNLKIKK